MAEAVILERHAAVATLRLNRPGSRNALTPDIRADLESIIPTLIADTSVRSVVLTGSGAAFCAGGDLNSWSERSPPYVRARLRRAHRWISLLANTDLPIVAAVNGMAAGAGLGLAMLGDIVIAGADARFQAGFPRVGAVPDFGIAWTLPRIVGVNAAKDMLLTNRLVDASEALSLGLVSRVVPTEQLDAEALAIAHSLGNGPTVSLGLTKVLLRAAYDRSLEQFLESEAMAQAIAIASADFGEGVEAFRKRRSPVFNGN